MRVLLIEDDAMSRDLMSLLLGNAGYEVTGAESGEQALQLLQLDRLREMAPPEVVLMDLQMPGLSGTALAMTLRAGCQANGSRTVLLAISASEPRRTVLQAYDGFLRKPFSLEALRRAIVSAGAGMACGAAGPSERREESEAQVLDEVVFERLLATMPEEKLRELYAFCIGDTRLRLERMRRAAEAGHRELFRRTAHEIRGACGMIGATELRGMAAALEEAELNEEHIATVANLDGFVAACDRLEDRLERHWVVS
jgi:CheY-like chemotaxis protein